MWLKFALPSVQWQFKVSRTEELQLLIMTPLPKRTKNFELPVILLLWKISDGKLFSPLPPEFWNPGFHVPVTSPMWNSALLTFVPKIFFCTSIHLGVQRKKLSRRVEEKGENPSLSRSNSMYSLQKGYGQYLFSLFQVLPERHKW